MHITQEELFDLIAAASSRLYTEMKLAYQSGRLKGYLASIGMVDLFPEEEERPLYDTYPDGKILIVGDSRAKPNEIYGCLKEYGIDNERIELRLGYEEAVNYPFRKLQYNPNYRLVLFGPIPHSVSRKGDKPSIIAHLENNDGYPKVIRLTDTNGQLKITKSNLKEAIWREIESGYLAV